MTDMPVEEFDTDKMFASDDPFALLAQWMDAAQTHEPSDPTAMSLATVDETGLPNVRIVLAKHIGSDGIVFYTNFESTKGRELLQQKKAALCFHWKTLDRQVRLRGSVVPVEQGVADDYFASRDRESQIGAWASQQSRPVASREAFEEQVAKNQARFEGDAVPRPEHWSGFRLVPVEFEFWHKRPFRLHDRLMFERTNPEMPWTKSRLFP